MSNASSPVSHGPQDGTHRRPYEAIQWRDDALWLLDQTSLPWRVDYRRITDGDSACEAIRALRVRGAPAIGIAAAYSIAAVSHALDPRTDLVTAFVEVEGTAAALAATRPTAVNLRWAIDRVRAAVTGATTSAEVAAITLATARTIHAEQASADIAMAAAGAALLGNEPSLVITHCNTGPLATGGGGTALGVIIEAQRRGLISEVLVDETRPRLQGARLTSWELKQHGVPHHVITDGAAAGLLGSRGVGAAFVGADRIAANGDTANKVGTFPLALACQYHGVPFYVVAPLSTFDLATADGVSIAVEERDPAEVLEAEGVRLAAPSASALNPAFDVTPAALVTAFITELGVLRPPFAATLRQALGARGATIPVESVHLT